MQRGWSGTVVVVVGETLERQIVVETQCPYHQSRGIRRVRCVDLEGAHLEPDGVRFIQPIEPEHFNFIPGQNLGIRG